MRPIAFAGDDVFQSIAIHVDQADRVHLGELDPIGVLFRLAAHDQVLFEGDLSIFTLILQPRQAVIVRVHAGDDVHVTVTVDIVGVHL